MKTARTETDSYNVLRIKHGVVEKCFGTSLLPFLRCFDEEQAITDVLQGETPDPSDICLGNIYH